MPEYTAAASLSVVVVLALERWVFRTGLLRAPAYWVTMAIVFFFQCLVDGWLTKLSAPIVLYSSEHASDIRVPWDIPVEDFLFGFSLLTAVLLLWEWARRREEAEEAGPEAAEPASDEAGRADRDVLSP